MPEARRLVLNPADTSQGYVLWSNGYVQPFGGAPPTDFSFRNAQNRVWDLQLIDFLTPSGFVLTDDGVVRGFGGCPNVNEGVIPLPVFRFMSMHPSGDGRGYIIQVGGIYDIIGPGGGPALSPSPPTFAYSAVRAFKHSWSTGDWLMILRDGGAHSSTGIAGPSWDVKPNRDVYRAMAVREWDAFPAFWITDYAGGVFVGNGAEEPPPMISPFLGRDVVRDIAIVSDGTGGNPLKLRLLTASGGFKDITVSEPPTVNVTDPAGSVTNTMRPTIKWDFTDPNGDAQQAYDVKIYAGSTADPDNDTPFERHNAQDRTTFEVRVDEYLENGDYLAYVRSRDTAGQLSNWDSAEWTQNVTIPAAPGLTATAINGGDGLWVVELEVSSVAGVLDIQYSDLPPSATDRQWRTLAEGIPHDATDLFDTMPAYNSTRYYRVRVRTGDGTIASPWSTEAEVTIAEPRWVIGALVGAMVAEVVPPFELRRGASVGVHVVPGRESPIHVFGGTHLREGTITFRTRTYDERQFMLDILTSAWFVLRGPLGGAMFLGLADGFDENHLRASMNALDGTSMGQVYEFPVDVAEIERPDLVT